MSISFISSFHLSVPLLKENLTHVLTDQQQKIMRVALLVFSLIAVLYLFCSNFLEAAEADFSHDDFSYPLTTEIDSPPIIHQKTSQKQETIYFYNKGESYYELTNFYENWRKDRLHSVFYQGQFWKTSEHAYQAEKFNWDCTEAKIAREQIMDASDARHAFKIAQQNLPFIRPGWHSMKDNVMLEILRAKFQDEHLSNVLRKTGKRKLVEASPIDAYWGYGSDGKGQNRLGILLMQIRKERFGF